MGDWFLFYMLGQNVDSMIFKEVRYSKIFKDIERYSKIFKDIQRGKNINSMIFKEVQSFYIKGFIDI